MEGCKIAIKARLTDFDSEDCKQPTEKFWLVDVVIGSALFRRSLSFCEFE